MTEKWKIGWLTDDNLEYIIKHKTINIKDYNGIIYTTSHSLITDEIEVRFDLANIYQAVEKARKGQDISDFVNNTKFDKSYTLFPIRVSGNHWGLLIKLREAPNFFYISSSNNIQAENDSLKLFSSKLAPLGSNTFDKGQKQTDAYNCGVFLIFYIWDILENQNIKLERTYTNQDILDFRQEWKDKIGEDKWCQEDTTHEVQGDDWASLGISEELKKQWFDADAPIGQKGFTFLDTQKLINFGFKPQEADLAKYLKNKFVGRGLKIEPISKFLNYIKDLDKVRQRYHKQSNQEPESDPNIPDWLFPEEEEKKENQKKFISLKPPKTTKRQDKPWECSICKKNTFYSRQEWIKAHGLPSLTPSIWVYKETIINKKPLTLGYSWICKYCKKEEHTPNCKYFHLLPIITPPPEIFDWKGYWKWWFGVNTLDWDSQRFFGQF